jgi:Cu+-exporting ATPase
VISWFFKFWVFKFNLYRYGVVLVRSNLLDVVAALDISRVTFQRIRLNLFFSLAYNALGIPVAAGALYPLIRVRLPPEVAALAMALSSVGLCTLNQVDP